MKKTISYEVNEKTVQREVNYIPVGACLVMPILILVMTTMMDGTVSVNPQTGAETVVKGFDNVWQILGSVSGETAANEEAAAKQKTWLSILFSLMVGMFLFMMIQMLTPLDSTIMNVVLCLTGSVLFGILLGWVSDRILQKTSLV